jgi:hypothetical protein
VLASATAAPAATVRGDAATLTDALRLEHAAEFTYRAATRSDSAEVSAIAMRFAPQETAHVSAIATAMEALGARKLPPPRSPAAVDAIARDFGISPVLSELRTPQETLGFMLAFEQELVAAWTATHRRLADASLLQTATSILGCQAQHLVVLRQALGRDPLPNALEPVAR